MRNGNLLKSRVSEICVKRIRVNQGVGVLPKFQVVMCCYGEWTTLILMYIIWWPLNNILMLCFLYCIIGLCSQEEERLVRDLFRGYNKLIRPVQNMTQKVEVAFGLAFIQLINVVSLQKQQHTLQLVKEWVVKSKNHCGLNDKNKSVFFSFIQTWASTI